MLKQEHVPSRPGRVDEDRLLASNQKVLPPAAAARIIINGTEKGTYRVLVGSDAETMDMFTGLVPERARPMIADQMASLGTPGRS